MCDELMDAPIQLAQYNVRSNTEDATTQDVWDDVWQLAFTKYADVHTGGTTMSEAAFTKFVKDYDFMGWVGDMEIASMYAPTCWFKSDMPGMNLPGMRPASINF